MARPRGEPMEQFNVRLPRRLIASIKQLAKRRKVSVSDLIRAAVEREVDAPRAPTMPTSRRRGQPRQQFRCGKCGNLYGRPRCPDHPGELLKSV